MLLECFELLFSLWISTRYIKCMVHLATKYITLFLHNQTLAFGVPTSTNFKKKFPDSGYPFPLPKGNGGGIYIVVVVSAPGFLLSTFPLAFSLYPDQYGTQRGCIISIFLSVEF